MEAPIALAIGAFGASYLWSGYGAASDIAGRPIKPTPEQEYHDKLEDVDRMWMHNASEYGVFAPTHRFETARLPWGSNPNSMPLFSHKTGQSHMDRPVTDTYQQLANGYAHYREDAEETFLANRPQMARRSHQPPYTGFTNEMTLRGAQGETYSTQHMLWSWLPRDPTDSDMVDAVGLMSKAAPPNPLLFNPSADFLAAPGVGFRYSAQ
jgi:hypothetical protein